MKNIFFIIITAILLFGCAGVKKTDTVFYPMPPQEPRLQFLTSITTEADIGGEKGAFKEFLLGSTVSVKRIARPYDIAATKGKIYLSDRTYKKILILDLENKTFNYLKAEKEAAIAEPAGLWVTEDDYKYLADFKRKQILVFDNENKFVRAYGEKNQFEKPLDVAVYGNKIYVCDFGKHQIAVLDKDSGETIQTIGESGEDEGKLYKPTHITLDNDGNIYVNDSFNFRIQKFNPNGEFEKKFGYQGDTLGGFARPKGLSISKDRKLYVVDTAFENVQIFDEESTDLLLFFGGFVPTPGGMYLPNGIHIDYSNLDYFKKYVDRDFSITYLVFVGNMLGDRKLNIYGFGKWIGAPLPEIQEK